MTEDNRDIFDKVLDDPIITSGGGAAGAGYTAGRRKKR